ncbi:hypothetical protein [Actinoallomurus acanthiterrae]
MASTPTAAAEKAGTGWAVMSAATAVSAAMTYIAQPATRLTSGPLPKTQG